jgi:hypothetical protein
MRTFTIHKQKPMKIPRYEVVASRFWRRNDGKSASPYGACPWTSQAEKSRWKLEEAGFTIRDNASNTVGLGRLPFKTMEEAEAHIAKLEALI